ncbi:MAG: hypothetical protein R2847_03460 [Bacteroidia bacterium]
MEIPYLIFDRWCNTYSYLWSSNGAAGTNQQSTLSNGTYTITVTDGNSLC